MYITKWFRDKRKNTMQGRGVIKILTDATNFHRFFSVYISGICG